MKPAMERASCCLTQREAEGMVKKHVPSSWAAHPERWCNTDPEKVVEHYEGLLCAIAQVTTRVNPPVITKAMQEIYKPSPTSAKKFGVAISETLRYCLQKCKGMSSGSKLSGPVKAVIAHFEKDVTPQKDQHAQQRQPQRPE